MKLNQYWFKPKKYGYGAYPITWEGWFLTLGFIAILMVLSLFLAEKTISFMAIVLVMGIILVIISKKKTKGPWKWHWG